MSLFIGCVMSTLTARVLPYLAFKRRQGLI
jgi:branched-subunit amino acid transport protein AzlD